MMLNNETRRKLRELNLEEMIQLIDQQQKHAQTVTQTFEERFEAIVDHVYQEKYNQKVHGLIRRAKFRIPNADVTGMYYEQRKINRNQFQELSTCRFIENNMNVIFAGFTGSGKTYCACALGKEACKLGIRTRYIRLPDLLVERDEASLVTKGVTKLINKYANYDLLILDEWLLDSLSEEEIHFIFELVERRYDTSSTIYCTQFMKKDWHQRLGGGVHADAMMDRIVHNAVWYDTGDKNIREYEAKIR